MPAARKKKRQDAPAASRGLDARRLAAATPPASVTALAQRIEHDAGLYAGPFGLRIECLDAVHILGEVQNNRFIATLAREACPAAPRQDRRAVVTRHGDCADDILCMARDDDADRDLAIVRSVGRIQRPASFIKPDLSFHHGT